MSWIIDVMTTSLTGNQILTAIIIYLFIIALLIFLKAPTYVIMPIGILAAWGMVGYGLPAIFGYLITAIAGIILGFMFRSLFQ